MPPDAGVPRRRLARRVARAARGDAALAVRLAPPAARRAVLAAGLAGAGLRRDRGRRSSRSPAGCDAYVDAGVPDAGALHGARRTLVGNWVHAFPDDAYPGPNLDWLHELVRFFDRWLRASTNGWEDEPAGRLVRARLRRAGAVPGGAGPGAGGRRPPTRTRAVARGRLAVRGGALPLAGRLVADRAARRPTPPASTATATARRSGRGPRCRGAPAGRPTAWPATCARTRRSARPTPRRRSTSRSRSSACRRPSSTWRRRCRSRPPSSGWPTSRPDGTSSQVSAGVLNLTHRRSDVDPEPLVPGRVEEVRIPLRHGRLPVRAGPPDPPVGRVAAWPVLWPSPFPASSSCTAVRRRRRASSCRSCRPPAARRLAGPGVQDDARRRARGRRRGRGRSAGLADRGGRHRRDAWPSPSTTAARTSSRTAAPLRRGDAGADRLGRRPGDAPRWTPTSSTAGRGRATGSRSGRGRARPATPTAFDLSVDLEVDLDGEPFFERSWHERSPAASSERRRPVDSRPCRVDGSRPRPDSFTESVIREMNRLAVAAGAVSLAQGFPDFACPPELKAAAARGRRRRHQPVRDHLGREAAARRDRRVHDGALPGLGRDRSRDAGHRHLRRDRGDDRRDARPARPGRRGHRLRAVLRELRPGRDPVRRGPALRHAPRAGLVDRPGRAARGVRPADARASSSTRRTTRPARCSRARSSR